jgi:type I restriction enzyme S subunit
MANIKDGRIYPDNASKVELTNQQYNTYKLNKGDLLFNRTNSAALVGKTAVVSEDMPFVFASYIVRLIIDSKTADSYYLGYILSTWDSAAKLRSLATPGVRQYNINPTTLKKHFWVALPPVQEQERIVDVLKLWDRAIDLTEILLTEKQQLRNGLMHHLLTGKKRLPGFTKSWRMIRLSEAFLNRVESNRTDLQLLSISADRGVIPRDEVDRKDSSSKDKSKYLRICPGDIGYNTMRMWQGVSGLSSLEGIVSPAYTIVTPKKGIDGEFMSLLFKSLPVVHLFCRYSQGLVSDTWNLKFRHFAEIKATVPEEAEQKAIANVFRSVNRELELLQANTDALREQKKGLTQQLLTGKKRVTECAS